MAEPLRKPDAPAFYALRAGGWRDYVTLLHPPYTLWHLSYVAIGWSVAAQPRADRLVALLIAFFLAVGIGAHALDELNGRPLRTRISSRVLWMLAAASLALACGIGIAGAARTQWSILAFVAAGAFLVPAYNFEWFGGRLHSDTWFALAWGAFPSLCASFTGDLTITLPAAVAAGACFALSVAQRTLSTPVRALRRRTRMVSGRIERDDGTVQPIDAALLRAAPESALRSLSIAVPLIAVALITLRLSG